MQQKCLCGSKIPFNQCCNLLISRQKQVETAEQLMRSRYCAYAIADIDYIEATMTGPALSNFNPKESRNWAQQVKWLGLNVTDTEQIDETHATVSFEAIYIKDQHLCQLKETSEFHCKDGKWYYVDGNTQHEHKKINLNQTCPCNSNKKFKRCCGK